MFRYYFTMAHALIMFKYVYTQVLIYGFCGVMMIYYNFVIKYWSFIPQGNY